MWKIAIQFAFWSFCFLQTVSVKAQLPLGLDTNVEAIPESDVKSDSIYIAPEVNAEFPGGLQNMVLWIGKKVVYPAKSKENGITGTVYVEFVVEKDGSITHVKVIRGVYPDLNEEAKCEVEYLPKFIPGKQNGKIVRTKMILPIKFNLS
jgi:protein TonB